MDTGRERGIGHERDERADVDANEASLFISIESCRPCRHLHALLLSWIADA